MKAQDMAQAVYKAERELVHEIADIVNKKLATLSEQTGLILGAVTISTTETTSFSDRERKWIVTGARIAHWMPEPICTE
ncbi:hypothetical protein [Sedimenticola selenatireducens]|uniref:Uncharacterized protein n=1 Tax=Sedimenticola selenatireducens TaxID=191960 RepID=A0A557SCF6_9GAMM|nr:hypothetical protein [Sedimenticola selenatireducens]TVO75099.1 hypothetical protein FHP88_08790 [Sedimenticola selenatireducens]TVT67047.1 MAG: hypothetical protein FHK78_01570 [Sedimenticola selenatireducens]